MYNTQITTARENYRPSKVKLLFIAEAPPCTEGQFFYFENVNKHDNLFLYLIRTVFNDLKGTDVKELRTNKEELLNRFKTAGYFLEDSVFNSIPKGTSNAQKAKIITANQTDLDNRISQYKDVPIILLSSLVHKCNYNFLKGKYNVLNETPIPFPGNGQQNKFVETMAKFFI